MDRLQAKIDKLAAKRSELETQSEGETNPRILREVRREMRKIDEDIDRLEELNDDDELSPREQRMADRIAEQLHERLKTAENKISNEPASEPDKPENEPANEPTNEPTTEPTNEPKKPDVPPAPEHAWFRERGKK